MTHRELLTTMYMKYYDKVISLGLEVDARAAASRLLLPELCDGEIRQELDYLSLVTRRSSLK